jgi:hypothetical protein
MVLARGGYRLADVKDMDNDELLFINHYQNLVESRQAEKFASYLGVYWDLEEFVKNQEESSGKPSTKLFIPLSVALRPEILEYVTKQAGIAVATARHSGVIAGGTYVRDKNEVVIPMSTLSKEDFLRMIGKPSAEQMLKNRKKAQEKEKGK